MTGVEDINSTFQAALKLHWEGRNEESLKLVYDLIELDPSPPVWCRVQILLLAAYVEDKTYNWFEARNLGRMAAHLWRYAKDMDHFEGAPMDTEAALKQVRFALDMLEKILKHTQDPLVGDWDYEAEYASGSEVEDEELNDEDYYLERDGDDDVDGQEVDEEWEDEDEEEDESEGDEDEEEDGEDEPSTPPQPTKPSDPDSTMPSKPPAPKKFTFSFSKPDPKDNPFVGPPLPSLSHPPLLAQRRRKTLVAPTGSPIRLSTSSAAMSDEPLPPEPRASSPAPLIIPHHYARISNTTLPSATASSSAATSMGMPSTATFSEKPSTATSTEVPLKKM